MAEEVVEQEGMVDEFVNQWRDDDSGGYVPQDVVENPVATPPENNAPTAKPEATPTESGKTPEKPNSEAPEVDEFVFKSDGEDGNSIFDHDTALDFALKTDVKTPAFEAKPNIAAPATPPEPVQPGVAQEPEITPREQMLGNLTGGLDILDRYTQLGYDSQTAMVMAKKEIEDNVDSYFQNKRFDDMEKNYSEREKALAEQQKNAEIKPTAIKNLNDAVTQGNWGTRKSLEKALFTPEIAGNFIRNMFERETNGQQYKTTEEYTGALNKWFYSVAADRNMLAMLEDVARAKITMRNLPFLLKNVEKTKQNLAKSKQAAQITSNNNRPRENEIPASVGSDELTDWLTDNNH